jgi:hypothetical protein
MALALLDNGGADHLAKAKPNGVVEYLGYFTLIEQARKTFDLGRPARRIGRKVPIRLLLNAGHGAPPFRVRPLLATVSTA